MLKLFKLMVLACAANLLLVVATDPPNCKCNFPPRRFEVKKEGCNKGRGFYKCARGGCDFFFWDPHTDKKGTARQSITGKRHNPEPAEPAHRIVGCASVEPLGDLPVYEVAIQPKQPLEGEKFESFRNRITATIHHNRVFQHVVVARRRQATESFAGGIKVVFLENPSPDQLQILESCTEETPCVASISGRDTISALGEWETYKAILAKSMSICFRQRGQQPFRDGLGVHLESKIVSAGYPGLRQSQCNITRGIRFSLTTHVVEDRVFLIVGCGTACELNAVETVAKMLAKGSIKFGCDVRARRDLEVSTQAGILCEPQENTTVSEQRSSLCGESLISYHNKYPRRKRELKAADITTRAVGLKPQYSLRAGRLRVLDFPPQLLEPIWTFKHIDPPSIAFTKQSPAKWREYAEKFARPRLGKIKWPEKSNIRFPAGLYAPSFQQAPEPILRDGPIANQVEVQPIFPDDMPEETRGSFCKQLETNRQKDNRLKIGSWTWREPIYYRANLNSVELQVELDELLRGLKGSIALTVFSQHPQSGREDSARDHWVAVKNAAAERDLPSQCIRRETAKAICTTKDPWIAKETLSSIDAKCGGQLKIAPHLADSGTYFVCFDVSRDKTGIAVGAAIWVIGSNGRVLVRQNDQNFFQRGETLDEKQLTKQLCLCLERVMKQSGQTVRRLVVCWDGRFVGNEKVACVRAVNQYNCTFDLVEVTKSGPDCLRIIQSRYSESKQPKAGTWFQRRKDEALLVTIGEGEFPRAGLVRPLVITHCGGTGARRGLPQIVAEQYAIARMRVYTSRPTRLPINLHLADRTAGAIRQGARFPNIHGIHPA